MDTVEIRRQRASMLPSKPYLSSPVDSTQLLTLYSTPDPSVEVEQDPKHTATSTLRKAIGVPVCAVKVSRNFRSTKSETQSNKRRKNGFAGVKSPLVEMGVASEGETLSDIEFLFSDDEAPTANGESKSKGKAVAM
jgi:ubiquitin-conjugating enzyme E2 Q